MPSNFFKRIKRDAVIAFHSIFYGLRGGDKEILQQKHQGTDTDSHVEQDIIQDNVYKDFLEERETQKVIETRDANYRVYRESDKYLVSGDFGDNVQEFKPKITKKGKEFYETHSVIADSEKGKIEIIQEQKSFDNDASKMYEEGVLNMELKPEHLITFDYTGFTPSFDITQYVKRIVVFSLPEGNYEIHLYFPDMAGQFTKTDAILQKKLRDAMLSVRKTPDFFEFKKMEFITNKAYGADDLMHYVFSGFKPDGCMAFDGNLVFRFTADADIFAEDIIEKYKTKELDEKYARKEQKSSKISFEAAVSMTKNKSKH